MMRFSFIRRSIPLVCFFSILLSEITGDLRVCALRISFQVDDDESTTGNGQYLLESNGIDCDLYTIDPVPHDRSYFESQLKAVDGYFNDVSYGKFGIDLDLSSVYPVGDNESYSLSNPMNFYNPYDQDEIQDERITNLFYDAVSKAYEEDQIDFSSYDLVVVFHAGIGQDFSLPFLDPTPEDIPSTYVDNEMVLEHLGSPTITVGNHEISHGIILPESQNHLLFDIAETMFSDASEPCEYQFGLTGTFALMIGFAVGIPPLWNIETGESGIGVFGLMDQGSNNGRGISPSPPTVWTRIFAGWEYPSEVNFGSIIDLSSREEGAAIKVPINNSEYYLIENRDNSVHDGISLDSMRYVIWENNGETDYPPLIEILQDSSGIIKDENGVVISVPNYDIGLPTSGLLIWHIDEAVINAGLSDYSVNGNLSRLGVDLEEADGAQDIGYPSIHMFNDPSAGYFGDMWFKGNTQYELANFGTDGMKPEFGPFTYPSTKANDGSSTFITIGDISKASDTMSFTVSNSLILNGFPDSTAFIRAVYDLDNDGINEIFGGKDSLWFATADSFPTKQNFLQLVILDNQEVEFDFQRQSDKTTISIIERIDDYTLFSQVHFRFSDGSLSDTQEQIIDSLLFSIWDNDLENRIPYSQSGWNIHSKRIFTSSFNYGIDLGNSGISITDFDGTTTKSEDLSFQTIAGIDLDLDASLDVLALDSLGILYAFNSDLTIMAGFQLKMELQSPILARDLFNDEHPEIVAKSADSSSIYIFDYQGNVHYKIASNKGDELVALENIKGKNSILTRSAIYQFGDATETNGNEWSFEHGNWGRSRKIKLNYTFDDSNKKSLTRSYCYPNPIRENTGTIRIETIGAKKVEVNLYNLAGYYIKTWNEDLSHFGNQITEWVWDVSDVESGVYFAHVAVIGDIETETNIIKIAVIH